MAAHDGRILSQHRLARSSPRRLRAPLRFQSAQRNPDLGRSFRTVAAHHHQDGRAMSNLIEDVAAAVLYEGYLLYPYRASATKNRRRWTFGVLYPREYAERQTGADDWAMQTECLVRAPGGASLEVRVRFLHLISQEAAVEREIFLAPVQFPLAAPITQPAAFEPMAGQQPIQALVELDALQIQDDLYKIHLRIQ